MNHHADSRSEPEAFEMRDSDGALIEQTLEWAAERCDDLTPAVYARFFARCPAAAAHFEVPDPTMPPLGCGQMLFEIISLIQDQAAGKTHVASYMHQISTEHAGYKVADSTLYREFLNALVDVIGDLVQDDWSAAHAQAWQRTCDALLAWLPVLATEPCNSAA